MRLLVITQKVDESDPVLGFFVDWLSEFSKHATFVQVICLEKGSSKLPENIQVHSLGKEHGPKASFVYAYRFLSLVWKLRNEYDSVFVHMNPEYVVLAGWIWSLSGKKSVLWYLHKSVTWKLRIASLFVTRILTATPESLRLRTDKKLVVGHGIDISTLKPIPTPSENVPIELITVGRLSPIKRVDLLIDAMYELNKKKIPVRFRIVGGAAGIDGESYEKELRSRVEALDLQQVVEFVGPIPHDSLNTYFKQTHIFLHASNTGSLDKAILEPLAVGVPVITTSAPSGSETVSALISTNPDPLSIATEIEQAILRRVWTSPEVRRSARAYVEQNHSLSTLIPKILKVLS